MTQLTDLKQATDFVVTMSTATMTDRILTEKHTAPIQHTVSSFTTHFAMDDWFETSTDFINDLDEINDATTTNVALTVVIMIVGIFGIVANSIIFKFYLRKRKDLIPLLYLILSGVDFFVSVNAVIHAITLTFMVEVAETNESFHMKNLLAFMFVVTALGFRISVFVNVVLVTVRTINISSPFYSINKKAILISIILVPVILFPIIVYDTYHIYAIKNIEQVNIKFMYKPFVGEYTLRSIFLKVYKLKSSEKNKYFDVPMTAVFSLSGTPFLLATVIAIVCLAINIYKLKQIAASQVNKTSLSKEREITITISMLTVIFVISTTVYTIYLAVMTALNKPIESSVTQLMTCYFVSTILPFINSALNPVILVLRGEKLRDAVTACFLCREQENKKTINATQLSSM